MGNQIPHTPQSPPPNPLSTENILFPTPPTPLSKSHIQFIATRCSNYSFLSNLPFPQIQQLASKFIICMGMNNQQWLLKQGSIAGYFFILQHGSVDVVKKGQVIRRLGVGDCFGEMALLYGIKRSSSIRVTKEWRSKNVYFALHRSQFLDAIQYDNPEKNQQFLQLIQNCIQFDYLTIRDKLELAHTAIKINFKAGQRILSKFDQPYCLFVIKQGTVRLNFPNKRQTDIGPKTIFGYYGSNSIESSATSISDTSTYAIGKDSLSQTLKQKIKYLYLHNRSRYCLFCSTNPKLLSLSAQRINKINNLFVYRYGKKMDTIARMGERVQWFYVEMGAGVGREVKDGRDNGVEEGNAIIGFEQFGLGKGYASDFVLYENGYYGMIDAQLFNKFIQDDQFQVEKQQLESFNYKKCQILCTLKTLPNQPQKYLCKQPKFNLHYILQLTPNPTPSPPTSSASPLSLSPSIPLPLLQSTYTPKSLSYPSYPSQRIQLKQYIRGTTIKQHILNIGLLPLDIVVFYVACMVVAVEGLHLSGLALREFGIGNFIIGDSGYLWMCEVGLKGQRGMVYGLKEDHENQNEKGNEKYQQQKVDFLRDFYQNFRKIGAITYQLLVGQQLFNLKQKILLHFPPNFKNKQAKQFILTMLFPQQLQKKREKSQKFNNPSKIRSQSTKNCINTAKGINTNMSENKKQQQERKQQQFISKIRQNWQYIKDMAFFKSIDWRALAKKQLQGPIVPGFMMTNPLKI